MHPQWPIPSPEKTCLDIGSCGETANLPNFPAYPRTGPSRVPLGALLRHEVWVMNAKDYHLAQTRPRVYVVGIRRQILDTLRMQFPSKPAAACTPPLDDFLDPTPDWAAGVTRLTAKQTANLDGQLQILASKMLLQERATEVFYRSRYTIWTFQQLNGETKRSRVKAHTIWFKRW